MAATKPVYIHKKSIIVSNRGQAIFGEKIVGQKLFFIRIGKAICYFRFFPKIQSKLGSSKNHT